MHIHNLPAELVLQVFRQCSSISSAVNLSMTCRRLYALLLASQKIPVLFAIAESVWGPVDDILQLLTYNASQAAHVKRAPVLSISLLIQVCRIGRVGTWYEELYAKTKWDNQRCQLRRVLSSREAYAVRRAIYRKWLYDVAFHNPGCPRTMRVNISLVAERCQLLRSWTTEELLELEDVRRMLENFLTSELCPTDGEVYWRHGGDLWNKLRENNAVRTLGSYGQGFQHLFHSSRGSQDYKQQLPAPQMREQMMSGWGDEVEQYHAMNALLKMTPPDIIWLHQHAVTKYDVEAFVEERLGGQWFWNNGQTLLHTWLGVLHGRGFLVNEAREALSNHRLGIVVDKT